MKAKPFIKWVGGKRQLLSQLEAALPNVLWNNEFTYIEPFLGGGAMFFFMLQNFPNINRVIVNDINNNLTEAFKNVKNNPDRLVNLLKIIELEYYLNTRKKFNEESLTSIEKSALLIFLNRTCFNGLYRENSKGKFNVPFGRYVEPMICNEEVIYADSELLNEFDVEILCGDFSQTATKIRDTELTFFYFDPPYRPLNTTSSFNTYVKDTFDDNEQTRLAFFCQSLSERNNCLWMLSNSDCSAKNPDDNFLENLYSKYNIQRVYAARSVNSVACNRGKLTELLISNYNPDNTNLFMREIPDKKSPAFIFL